MKKVLDDNGLAYFWQKAKAYIDSVTPANIIDTVNMKGPDALANVTVEAADIPYDSALSVLSSLNVQNALDELDKDLRYNAIYVFDATVQSAPPNLPRGYNWHVDMIGPMMNDHQYSRYFYLNVDDAMADQPGAPLLDRAVAHWVIDGKHVYFEYLTGGVVTTVVDITDTNGDVLLPTFRPIADTRVVWFFGKNQADPFPTDDNIRSILDINVWGLTVMLGNTFDLTTTSKQIVGAINEVNSKIGAVQVYEASDVVEAQTYSQANPNVFVFVPA